MGERSVTGAAPDRGEGDPLWVFAYGSLMWRPGFPYLDSCTARLHGYHRALCIYSWRYRGTPERPGLVMGLDRGGSCIGVAYLVAPENRERVITYLYDREMLTKVYRPTFLPIRLKDGRRVSAYCFVAIRDHEQYAGRLSVDEAVDLVCDARGEQGPAKDYLANTVAHLDDLGITDGPLHRILERAKQRGD